MLDMENAPAACEGAGSSEADNQKYTHFYCDKQAAGRAIADALTCDADAQELALILRHRLTEPDLLRLMAATAWALRPCTAGRMARAIEADAIAAIPIIPTDRVAPTPQEDAERQKRQWAASSRRARR